MKKISTGTAGLAKKDATKANKKNELKIAKVVVNAGCSQNEY